MQARAWVLGVIVAAPAVVGCATPGQPFGRGGTDASRTDAASVDAGVRPDVNVGPSVDAWAPGSDAWSSPVDAAPSPDAWTMPGMDAAPSDAWIAPSDAWIAPNDAWIAPVDVGTDAGRDAGPRTPGPGSYLYTRTPIGGMHEAVVVAFHPDGSYALVLERDTNVRVYDWSARTAAPIDLRVGGRALVLTDVSFDPGGGGAHLVGYERVSGADTGVVIRFDDATWRAAHDASAFTRTALTRSGERFVAIQRPPAGDGPEGDGRPVVLSQSGTSPYLARLRDLDPDADAFGAFIQTRNTSAGCDDLAFADNEFGTWGIVLVCGTNGADAPYYTEIGGVGQWRPGPAATLGNASRADTHGGGDYALGVSWSGRDLDRFQQGAWLPSASAPGWATIGVSASAPGWATIGVWDVSFSPDGVRALVVGRASGGASLVGSVLEYRHDLYATAQITNVSIPGFASAPYLGTSNTNLNDSAFRPGCEGGLIVGGETSAFASTGMIVEFQIEGGIACR